MNNPRKANVISLLQLLEERPELLGELQKSAEFQDMQKNSRAIARTLRTGETDEEFCRYIGLSFLRTEAMLPGSVEPVYEALRELIGEHGVEEGARIAQERFASVYSRILFYVIQTMRNLNKE